MDWRCGIVILWGVFECGEIWNMYLICGIMFVEWFCWYLWMYLFYLLRVSDGWILCI